MTGLNNNKAFILSLSFLLFVLCFCKKDDTNTTNDKVNLIISEETFINLFDEQEYKIYLSTQPAGNIEWNAECDAEWLTINPTSGEIKEDIIEVTLKGDTSGLSGNSFHTILKFKGSNVYVDKDLSLNLFKSNLTQGISISNDELTLDYGQDTASFKIINTGQSDVNYSITDIPEYLQLSQNSGMISGNSETSIIITVNRTMLSTDQYISNLAITADISQSESIDIIVNDYSDELEILPFLISDAQYVQNKDKIAIITKDPNQLLLFDPVSLEWEELEIPSGYLSFSVEPEGNLLAIGYLNKFLLVNLNTMTLVNEFELELELFSILLRNSNWAYAFSSEIIYGYYSTHVQSINLTTGEVFQNYNWGRTNQKGALHASENYIYSMASSRFYKYDITADTASRLYYKDGGTAGKFWLTDEGDKLFMDNGEILRLSEDEENDLIYGGMLGEDIDLIGFDQASSLNLICCLIEDVEYKANNACSHMRTYTLDFVSELDVLKLPSYFIPQNPTGGTVYQPDGKFIFVNSTEDKVFILQRAEPGYPGIYNWAITYFDLF